MKNIRRDLGVCPQHDILFDDLTVKEHLELYAAFKGKAGEKHFLIFFVSGMKPQDIHPAVDKMIKELDFAEKKNFIAKNLSGGQKRKLSVGIAFIGGSKIIILDEPTSV
jgi:ATP-binding cassette, subfamily A (ABC1), member 3